jgi:hypothetical protein
VLEFDKLQKFIAENAYYDSDARFPPPRCYPETRIDVLEKITNWIDDLDPTKRIFWLSGPAGAGKSAITQTIAERCKDTQLAASFFFQRKTKDCGMAVRLFLTLAWQLALSIPEIRPYIESTLKIEPSIHTKSIDVQFDLLFVQIFEKLLRDNPDLRPQRFLVIIDAVDECANESDQRMILTLIGAQISERVPLRFLISSRPEPHIEETFDTSIMKGVTRALLSGKTFASNDDIKRYLEGELYRIFTERRILPVQSIADIVDRLVLKSSGQFIYAATVIKFVDDKYDNPKERLNVILGTHPKATSDTPLYVQLISTCLKSTSDTSPYAQLDKLYTEILSQQKRFDFSVRYSVARILAFGQLDFTDNFASEFPWVSKETLKLKLRRMRSLLHISDSGIKPYHLSLFDFFEDKKRSGKYYISPWSVTLIYTWCGRDLSVGPPGAGTSGNHGLLILLLVAMILLDICRLSPPPTPRLPVSSREVYTNYTTMFFTCCTCIKILFWCNRKLIVIRRSLVEPPVN